MHWQTVAPRLAVGVASLALLSGCVAGANSSPSVSPTSVVTTPSASAPPPLESPSPSPSPRPTSTAKPQRSPAATESFAGSIVTTVADDGLRVRSEPGVSDESRKLEPLLPLGTALYVLDGPVSASGYDWYEVAPLTSRTLPSGWVASASRDGEPWIEGGDFDCPPVPTDYRSLAALPPLVGLACFPRVPITVEARLVSCNCDIDGGWFTPHWFSNGTGGPEMLVERGMTKAPANSADWDFLHLDPAGEYPDKLPLGEVVEVTGMFDHPAATSCTFTEMDGEPVPSQGCRLEFAVTRLRAK
jgi:hypothetical protein